MNGAETAAAAAAWLRYERSEQGRIDRIADRQRRATADLKAGHIPACTLTKCAPGCPKRQQVTAAAPRAPHERGARSQ